MATKGKRRPITPQIERSPIRYLRVVVFALAIFLVSPTPTPKTHFNNSETKVARTTQQAGQTNAISDEQPAKTVEKAETPKPPAPTPSPESVPVTVTGTCESEIAKYDWSIPVATAVAQAESRMDPGAINDNPSTGDYSIGCFQVNLYGSNALYRPSEPELKDPAVNVAYAYKLYSGNGNSFIGQWGVCRSKVSCY